MWLVRAVSSLVFLFLIVFTVPLAFDVGGRDCGLAFSLSLATFYFLYSTLRLLTPEESRFRFAFGQLIKYSQWPTILVLMIWCLNKFSVDANNASGSWVERTFSSKQAQDTSIQQWLFGRRGFLEDVAINGWDKLLRYSTPVFQLLEGFCSLLVIQACGQITRWLVNKERGDSWMIGLLGISASIISGAIYFLWRITTFPELGNVDALLIGVTITCAVILGSWGIGSGRGNPVESSLLFAYITLCIYQIFTDYKPSSQKAAATPPLQPDYPPLPPMIMATYTTLLYYLSSLPSALQASWNFFLAAVMTITPSVIISLIYRVFVMYAAARIIPAVRESGARALSQEPSLEDSDEAGRLLGFLSWFSPSILIAVYTSLLMQHFSSTNGVPPGDWWTSRGGDAGGNSWRWLNVLVTMVFYAVELYMGRDEDVVTSHWKID